MKTYWIVWNKDKSEALICDHEKIAREAMTGASAWIGRINTVADKFYATHGAGSTVEQIEIEH